MQPAPIPPRGSATWVARSPLKVRCGPGSKSSSEEAAGGWEICASGSVPAKGTAAPNAAEEVTAMNSLRVDLSNGDIGSPYLPGSNTNRCAFAVSTAFALNGKINVLSSYHAFH